MCWVAAVAQTGLQIAGAVMQQKSAEEQARAQGEAVKAQAESAIKGMNFSFQGYEAERQDAFDQAVREIEKVRLNSMQLKSQVDASLNEDMAGGGRTADLIRRSVQGDEDRAVHTIKDNYSRKSNEIDLNKEATLISTKDSVNNMKPPEMPSRASMYLNIASSVIGGYTAGKNAQTDAQSKGMDWDFWRGAYKK